jgi:hypothetical protein
MVLPERVKRILLTPKEEWQVIDIEPATLASLYTGYITLAAIGLVAQAIGYRCSGSRSGHHVLHSHGARPSPVPSSPCPDCWSGCVLAW